MSAINTPTLRKRNVLDCKKIFENFQEIVPRILCYLYRKIYALTYMKKIGVLRPHFTNLFTNCLQIDFENYPLTYKDKKYPFCRVRWKNNYNFSEIFMQALPAINTPTLQKANVPECKEIFENFQENFPGIRCFQCRKIHVLIYTQKIEILAPLFYEIFSNKNLANKKCALRRIKKRSEHFLSRPVHNGIWGRFL